MEGDNYGHRHPVSRRGAAPAATSSSKRVTGNNAAPPTSTASKRKNEGIEMRPLLRKEPPVATSSSTAHPGEGSAKQFAESFLGQMIKLKEARKHAYNLRANFKSKRFHVHLPKRMLFIIFGVFLVGPLILFINKENELHHHDPAYDDVGKNHSHGYHNQRDPRIRGSHNAKKNGGINHRHHNSLQQLLGGANATDKANSTHRTADVRGESNQSEDPPKSEENSISKEEVPAKAGETSNKKHEKDTETATESIDGMAKEELRPFLSRKNTTTSTTNKMALDSQSTATLKPGKEEDQSELMETASDKLPGSASQVDTKNTTLALDNVEQVNITTLPREHIIHDEERNRRLLARNIARILKLLN